MIRNLNLNVSGKRDVALKQRLNRFPSIGDHIHVTPTFEHSWATLRHTVIGGSYKSKDWYQFHRHSNCNI